MKNIIVSYKVIIVRNFEFLLSDKEQVRETMY